MAGAVVFVIVAVAAELFGRAYAPQGPGWFGSRRDGMVLVGHPTRLWGLEPGARRGFGVIATINTLGLRGPPPELPRPKERARVLVLGDSSLFGHGVSDERTLSRQLERALSTQLSTRLSTRGLSADVVNGAIPGYTTEQSLVLMDEVGWDLEPTLLLLGNLWSDNSFDRFYDRDLLHTQRRFAVGLASHSAFFRWLAVALDRFRPRARSRIVTWTTSSRHRVGGVRRVPLDDYARNLDLLVREARSRGIGAALLAPSNRETVREGLARRTAWSGYFDAQARVAQHHAVPRIDSLPAFQAAVAGGATLDDLFLDQMHPTVTGLSLTADLVAGALIAAGWPAEALLGSDAPYTPTDLRDRTGGVTDHPVPSTLQLSLFEGPGVRESDGSGSR